MHTLGPRLDSDAISRQRSFNGIGLPCTCGEPHVFFCRTDCQCNCGRLIAAAPDMLDIARLVVDASLYWTGTDEERNPLLKRLRTLAGAVMAKAENR